MSNVLAIAAVTHLLKDLLNDAFIDGDVTSALGADFSITALPPHLATAAEGETQPTVLNLFLHRITTNPTMRNMDLPTRTTNGQLLQRPRLALDLHYILTVISAQELHSEILLGYAMQLFHETAILPKERIRSALSTPAAIAAVSDEILPDDLGIIQAARLADQLELVKISPRTLSMDDMSKLWTALQASYRTTVAYDVSVVLIERETPTRPTLPVLTRGDLEDTGVSVRSDLLKTAPSIEIIAPMDGQPVMRLGRIIEIKGQSLDQGTARVRFAEPGTDIVLELAPQEPVTSGILRVQLPSGPPLPPASSLSGTAADPAVWRIGSYIVDILYLDGPKPGTVSNALPTALAPSITPALNLVAGEVVVTVSCEPVIRPNQIVSVIVGQETELVPSPIAPTDTIIANFTTLISGARHPVRLRVDGIDNPIINRQTTPPTLDTELIP